MIKKEVLPEHWLLPPGPQEEYDSAEELLSWLKRNCEQYGEIFSASVCGSNVYVIGDPDDYEIAAPQFRFFAEEAARDFKFAQSLGPLKELILKIVAARRRQNRMYTDSLGVMMQPRDRYSGER